MQGFTKLIFNSFVLLIKCCTFYIRPHYTDLVCEGVVPQHSSLLAVLLDGHAEAAQELEEARHEVRLQVVLYVEEPAVKLVVSGQPSTHLHELTALVRVIQDLLQHLLAFNSHCQQMFTVEVGSHLHPTQ